MDAEIYLKTHFIINFCIFHIVIVTNLYRCCNSKEESSLAQLLRDTDPPMTGDCPGRTLHLENSAGGGPRSQYQQNKFLDGGGNFVDPNKVLPGHFAGKGMGEY